MISHDEQFTYFALGAAAMFVLFMVFTLSFPPKVSPEIETVVADVSSRVEWYDVNEGVNYSYKFQTIDDEYVRDEDGSVWFQDIEEYYEDEEDVLLVFVDGELYKIERIE